MSTVSENTKNLGNAIQEGIMRLSRSQYITGQYVAASPDITSEMHREAVDKANVAMTEMWKMFYSVMSDYHDLATKEEAIHATLSDIVNEGYMPSREGMPHFD